MRGRVDCRAMGSSDSSGVSSGDSTMMPDNMLPATLTGNPSRNGSKQADGLKDLYTGCDGPEVRVLQQFLVIEGHLQDDTLVTGYEPDLQPLCTHSF